MCSKVSYAVTKEAEPMIGEVAAFVEKAYRGVFGKGTDIPYITHLLGAAVIAPAFTDDEEMVAAVLLRDIIEDTEVAKGELEGASRAKIACLVTDESEDKRKTWQKRKGYTARYLSTTSRGIKILASRDRLSNMRSTARDYLVMGDAIWQRFNEGDKKEHAWYCWEIARASEELEEHVYYQRYTMLCRNVFGLDMYLSGEEFPYSYNS